MEYAIFFIDNHCPMCNGNIVAEYNKDLHGTKHINTIVGYTCQGCNIKFHVHYVQSEKDENDYVPMPMYLALIDKFKKDFLKEE